ncbi:MAG: SufD family Fe-S cluster assembly protein [Alistipes sp.]|nr:SufD family Fe-S cluster assembly protein [Alistipes sp.]
MTLIEYFNSRGLRANTGMCTLGDGNDWEVAINPEKVERTVRGRQRLIVVHSAANTAKMHFDLCEGASLSLVELFTSECSAECTISQQADSRCDVVSVSVAGSVADYAINLDGQGADNRLRSVYIAGGEEHTRLNLRVNHNVSDCTSDSLVKGVAGGYSTGEFHGMVYVAEDAQRTDARQTNRNIEIGPDAKIITKPQLEIYADDVKCSHGATVGQMDSEAIMYMRQRGLSEQQARRIQIEGFVNDIVMQAGEIGSYLADELTRKLENL